MLTGLISFTISGIILGLIGSRTNEGLLLLLELLLAVIIGFFIPSLRDLQQIKAQVVPNIVVLIVADAIYGALLGHLFYGGKSIRHFAFVCGIASIPFGILVSMPFKIAWISFDQNLLFILVSFGTTTGLSIGLYSLLKLKNKS